MYIYIYIYLYIRLVFWRVVFYEYFKYLFACPAFVCAKKGVVSFVRFSANKGTRFHIYYRYFTPFSNDLNSEREKK